MYAESIDEAAVTYHCLPCGQYTEIPRAEFAAVRAARAAAAYADAQHYAAHLDDLAAYREKKRMRVAA